MEISDCPAGLEGEFKTLFSSEASNFLEELILTFGYRVDEILRARKITKLTLENSGGLPNFQQKTPEVISSDWKVAPLPQRLLNRHLDLGDVAPSNVEHLKRALNANVQGIQIDYDDGCCPSWANIITGIYNIVAFTRGKFYPEDVPLLEFAPILMLRPRAWNMIEHNVLVMGKEIAGPLLDFGLLIFHAGKELANKGVGPFFYLSKVEGANEAALWNDIFTWAQAKLNLPYGTIKACVLIENILASFEMEEILFELKDHSLGLNCGIWDYAASFVNKFGRRPEFLLPDRNKYVNMEKHFLSSYMKLVVQTCHRRGAMATGGMAALVLDPHFTETEKMNTIEQICKAKLREIHSGVDGFMVYDTKLVPWINELWQKFGGMETNQISSVMHKNLRISAKDLLQIPQGGVTHAGVKQNIKVGISFIFSWLKHGQGHFILDGAVEDSATAEISRSQIWQWIHHQARFEDGTREKITKYLICTLVWQLFDQLLKPLQSQSEGADRDIEILRISCRIFIEIVTSYDFPEFITTYLYNHTVFRQLQNS